MFKKTWSLFSAVAKMKPLFLRQLYTLRNINQLSGYFPYLLAFQQWPFKFQLVPLNYTKSALPSKLNSYYIFWAEFNPLKITPLKTVHTIHI